MSASTGKGDAAPEFDTAGQLTLLNEVGRIAVTDLDLRPMLQRITDLLHERLGWELVACISIDLESRAITCEAISSDDAVPIRPGETWPLGQGIMGTVALTGEPIVADDVTRDPRYVNLIKSTRSELCVPVRHGGRVVAAFNAESPRLAAFQAHLPMMQAVADQVSGAIAGARLYEELKRRAALTEMLAEVSRIALEPAPPRTLIQRVVGYLHENFSASATSVILLDESGTRFVDEIFPDTAPMAATPSGEWSVSRGIAGRCARLGRPVYVADVTRDPDYIPSLPGIRSEFAVPIRHGARLLGVLNVESTKPDAFPIYVQRAYVGLADQVAGAIAGARLAEHQRQHVALLEMLNRLAKLATEHAELTEVLHNITDLIAAEFDVAVASILLLDEGGRHFIIETMSGWLPLDSPTGGAWPITVGVCGRCVRTGEPQLVHADDGDPDYHPGHEDILAEYVVPLRVGEQTLGVLNLESIARETFTPEVRRTLDAVAEQIAGAIHLGVTNRRLSETNALVAERTAELARANAELKRVNLELKRISAHDPVTDIPNRRRFDEVLRHEWRWGSRTGAPLAVLVADLDHFKALNDTHGHPYGDDCLRQVARCLSSSLRRAPDFVARYGGEEFALVLPECDLDGARAVAEALRAAVEALNLEHRASPWHRVTISIGAAVAVPERNADPLALVAAADTALYAAKAAGRNRIETAR